MEMSFLLYSLILHTLKVFTMACRPVRYGLYKLHKLSRYLSHFLCMTVPTVQLQIVHEVGNYS